MRAFALSLAALPIAGLAGGPADARAVATPPPAAVQEEAPDAAGERADAAGDGLPADITPGARALFDRLRAALGLDAPDAPSGPIRAFEVRFELLSRLGDQTNEFRADVRYLAPRFVRVDPDGAATFGLGPAGSWLEDRGEVVLTQGREYEEDRRLLRQALVLCQHFAGLGDVDSLAITRAEVLEEAPRDLPRHRGEQPLVPRKLDWLELETADLDLFAEASAAADPTPRRRPGEAEEPVPSQARFGLDPETGELRALHVRRPPLRPMSPPTERFVVFEAWTTLDGRRVPSRFFVYDRDPAIEGLGSYGELPNQEVFLLSGRIDPELTPESFDP